jgi:exosortase A
VGDPVHSADAQAAARRFASRAGASANPWPPAAIVLALGAACFAFIFRTEVARAIGVWNDSTAYNHCYLILPISAWLVWERRRPLLSVAPAPALWPLIAMLAAGLVWLIAVAGGLMEGRQLAAMTLFQLFLFSILGPRAWRVIAFALLYLYFLVPAGAFITPVLQNFAANFAVRALEILYVPVYSDGFEIDVPGARFEVAEACAGLRFLIASIALGALYGYMMYRTATRRIVFLSVSIVVPIIANGFRVLGIVLLGFWLSDAEAAAADHLIYGWVFFSAVSLVLILIGLPFRQAPTRFAISGSPPSRSPGALWRLPVVGAAGVAIVALLTSPIVAQGPPASALALALGAFRQALGR